MVEDTLIGQQLDEYRLEDLLGQGGMARVYRALDVRLKRWVAIKVIDSPFRSDSDYIKRFEREAQAIAQLEHPHIVRLYRYGEVNQLLYMAMQYIEGAPLSNILAGYRQDHEFIEPGEASRIIREIGLALDYAHHKGVIHRDIKPSNIMLTSQGSAILTDFGLALLTDIGTRGEIFGTPHYIAPEQAVSSARVTPQSDLYSVGVMLYEIFTNELPFDAAQPLDIVMLHMTKPPPSPREFRPDLSPALEKVILQSLAKEPEERYPTGAALADALDEALRASSGRRAGNWSSAPSISIPDRVALGLAEHALPPMPAAISDPTPAPPTVEPEAVASLPVPPPQPITLDKEPVSEPIKAAAPLPAPVGRAPGPASDYIPTRMMPPKAIDLESTVRTETPQFMPAGAAPTGKPLLFYIGVGIGTGLVIIVLLVALSGLGYLWWQRSAGAGGAVANQAGATVNEPVSVASDAEASATTTIETGSVVIVTIEASLEPSPTPLSEATPTATELPPAPALPPTEEPTPTATEPPPSPTLPPTETPTPTATEPPPSPTLPPTETPTSTPVLAADSAADFSQTNANWEYLAARPANSTDFKRMKFETRRYGDCWYDEDYIRICSSSGHPGNGADVAWRWKSQANGYGQVFLSVYKIDQGGDGVVIELYHNGQFIRNLAIGGRDTQGVRQQNVYQAGLEKGDELLFVMKRNGNANSDHTFFQAQIYQNVTH
jgi:serine/threonine protein kinase